jgi:ethanolamine utilization protein EutQ (cupin superfamily)
MQQQDYSFRIDEKSIKNISKSIASEVADRIYYEFLLARYMPEVLSIENGSVAPIKTEDFKQQLMSRINSMAK